MYVYGRKDIYWKDYKLHAGITIVTKNIMISIHWGGLTMWQLKHNLISHCVTLIWQYHVYFYIHRHTRHRHGLHIHPVSSQWKQYFLISNWLAWFPGALGNSANIAKFHRPNFKPLVDISNTHFLAMKYRFHSYNAAIYQTFLIYCPYRLLHETHNNLLEETNPILKCYTGHLDISN